jgi:hypothetical protein
MELRKGLVLSRSFFDVMGLGWAVSRPCSRPGSNSNHSKHWTSGICLVGLCANIRATKAGRSGAAAGRSLSHAEVRGGWIGSRCCCVVVV